MKRFLFSVAAILCAATSVMAQFNPMEAIAVDKEVRIGRLPSGITYYIRHNEKPKGQADFYIRSDVGAIQEADDQQGLAHFLEHMAFNGTKNLPGKQMLEYLEAIGVQFGTNLNANTSWDQTNYLIQDVPVTREGIIDTALLILHDWSSFIDPQPAEIDSERGVISEELRTRDNAGWRASQSMIKAIGKDTRYAERNVIGYLDFLNSFPYEALTRFYHDWYRPDYQAVVVVGDIDVDQVEQKIIALMSDLPKASEDAPQKEVIKAIQNEEPIISIYTDPEMKNSSVELFIKGEDLPREINNTYYFEMVNILRAYFSAMQNERLVEIAMKPNAPFVNAGLMQGSIGIIPTLDNTLFSASATDGKLCEAFEALVIEMEKTRRYGFTMGEFERAQANIMQIIEQQYNNRNDNTNNSYVTRYLDNFTKNTPIPDAHTEFQLDSMLVMGLTVADVNSMVQQVITPQNQVITISAPEKEGLVNPTEQDIKDIIAKVSAMEIAPYEDNVVKLPLIDPSIKLNGSKVKKSRKLADFDAVEWTLKNGVQVVVRPSTLKADEVNLEAQAKGGTAILSDDDFNTGSFLSTILGYSGVGNFSVIDLQRQLSGKNAESNIWSSGYASGVSAKSSVKDIETMLQLVYLNFTAPRFNEDDFNTVMHQYHDYAKNATSSPDFLFDKFSTTEIYGNHPRRQSISTELLDDVKFERLPAIFNTLFPSAKSFRFVITGNVDLETLKPLVEKYIGSIPAKGKALKTVDDGVREVEGEFNKDIKVTMAQPKVSILHLLSGEYKDYTLKNRYTARFLSEALDGRYLTAIREEKGGTYGVRVNASLEATPREKFSLIVQFDTNETMADELSEIVVDELEKMAQNGPTEEQMDKTRKFLIKDFNNKLESNLSWTGKIFNHYNYGFNEASEGIEAIESVTAEDVREMMEYILEQGNHARLRMLPKAE